MTQSPINSPAIAKLLSRLRRRIRAYVWLEGCATVIATAGIAFWAVLAVDYLIEPPPVVRVVLLSLVAVALTWILYRQVLARSWVRLSDVSLALVLERRGRSFGDSLLTAVELATANQRAPELTAEMLQHTTEQAASRARGVQLNDIFNYRPLWRKSVAALVALASIGAFAFYASESFAFYIQRLALASETWPRRTRLVIEGFPPDADGIRRLKVAKGGAATLIVRAENSSRFEIPQRVEVLYTLDDGSRGRGDAKKIGNAVPGLDEYQEFQFAFDNLHDSHTFDVVARTGGVPFGLRDERIRGLRLEVVESPGVYQKSLHVTYPEYMQRTPATIEATAAMQVPRGVKISISATANKPLARVRIDDSALPDSVVIGIPESQSDRRTFRYDIPILDEDRVLLFSLTDTDGITTAEADRDRLAIRALTDEPPQVTVRLQGIGTAITTAANIPLRGQVKDDYGVEQLAFEHRVGEGEVGQTPLTVSSGGRQDVAVSESLDVRPLDLQPKQALSLWLKARDGHALGDGPQEGSSTRFELQVVTPEDLRGLLDRDELRLRQRFEAVYEEMLRTREILTRLDVTEQSLEASSATSASEQGATADDTAERTSARRRLQLMKALHYIERGGHDTLSVASGFDDIYEQMVNNRIESEDARQRLVGDIATPLRTIGGKKLTALAERLERMRAMTPADNGETEAKLAIAEADDVLVEMKKVLDRMQQLGDFNELVEMLREIMKDQDRVSAETKKQRTASTRSLLED